jgi:hypothetical protein
MTKKIEYETVKASFNIKPELLKKLRYISVVDEETQTEIINRLLTDHIEKWEKKKGPIPGK